MKIWFALLLCLLSATESKATSLYTVNGTAHAQYYLLGGVDYDVTGTLEAGLFNPWGYGFGRLALELINPNPDDPYHDRPGVPDPFTGPAVLTFDRYDLEVDLEHGVFYTTTGAPPSNAILTYANSVPTLLWGPDGFHNGNFYFYGEHLDVLPSFLELDVKLDTTLHPAESVPEPAAAALLAGGVLPIIFRRRRAMAF